MSSSNDLDGLLKILMEKLEAIGARHEELYDTEVREQMFKAVHGGFLIPQADFTMPRDFGMFSEEGNTRVGDALSEYIVGAYKRAAKINLQVPNKRLAAFQNQDICTDKEKQYPDDFFGWSESIE